MSNWSPRRENWAEKIFQEITAEKFSDSVTHICTFTNSKSSASLKQDNFEGNHA